MRKSGLSYAAGFAVGALVIASAASAARLGHAAYSASAATAAQKQWNIIADPAYATDGSTTTLYSPSAASLNTVDADGSFYLIKILVSDLAVPGHVIEQDFSGAATSKSYTFNFTSAESAQQVGAVQVFWSLTPATTPGVMPPQPAYDPSFPGSADEDTDNVIFDNLSANPTSTFTNYQNPGSGSGDFPNFFPNADYYEGYSPDSTCCNPDPFYYGGSANPTEIASDVTDGVPEPGGLMAVGLVSSVLLIRRHRRPASA
jgi:hypothetical protein